MEHKYLNTNIKYIEPNYEERMGQYFSKGDVVLIGPRYLTTENLIDIYKDDKVCGQVGEIVNIELPDEIEEPAKRYREYKVSVNGETCWLFGSRLILIRSAG